MSVPELKKFSKKLMPFASIVLDVKHSLEKKNLISSIFRILKIVELLHYKLE